MTPEQIETIVLSAVLTLAASILTAFLTAKTTRENEMRKRIHEKRLELYLEFHDVLEKMLGNRDVVFDRKYYNEVSTFKPKIKLLASKKTVERYNAISEYLRTMMSGYEKYENDHDPERDLGRMYYDEDGDPVGYDEPKVEDYEAYSYGLNRYKSEHRPSKELAQEMIGKLYESMRNDLGSNLK